MTFLELAPEQWRAAIDARNRELALQPTCSALLCLCGRHLHYTHDGRLCCECGHVELENEPTTPDLGAGI